MNKIATHDSGTGEKSKNFIHALGKVFAQTQTKTIEEQWECGVRYFDLRVDKDLTICHGLWKANKNLYDILNTLNYLSYFDKDNTTYYQITIERNYDDCTELINKLDAIQQSYSNIVCTKINRKYPVWKCIYSYVKLPCAVDYVSVPTPQQYLKLSIKDWKRYIPIPRVLHKVYKRKHEFNNKMFTMVDFI